MNLQPRRRTLLLSTAAATGLMMFPFGRALDRKSVV